MKFEKIVGATEVLYIASAADNTVFTRSNHISVNSFYEEHGIDMQKWFEKAAFTLLFTIPHDHPTKVLELILLVTTHYDENYYYKTHSIIPSYYMCDKEVLESNIKIVSEYS